MADSDWVRIASEAEVREAGGVLGCSVGGVPLAIYEVDGAFYVTQGECTHGNVSLAEGYLEGCLIECPYHQGLFDVRTGEVMGPPCTVPLRVFEVHRDGDGISIARESVSSFSGT
jgi:nitrite reductase/ring-hydroxylating ferredoxin subunit